MNEKLFKIFEALFWIVISVILAICDFAKGGIIYTIFGCIFAAVSILWTYILAKYVNEYRK